MVYNLIEKLISLKSHVGFIKYFKNTSWLFGEKILRIIAGLLVGIWVARYLGPEQFGLFSYAQSFAALFTAVATLGLDVIVIRELVKNESHRDNLIGTAFWLKLLGALTALMLIAITINFTTNEAYTKILVFIIASAMIFQSFNVIDLYYQSQILSKYVVFVNTFSLILSSIIKIVLILKEATLISFALVIIFDGFILSLGYIYFYTRISRLRIFAWHFEWLTAIRLIKASWPLILSGLVVTVYMKIDQIMIKEMLDNESVGQYAAAVRLSEAIYFIPVIISSSLFPAILNAKKNNTELYHQRLQRLFTLMVWLALLITIPMVLLSDWIVNTLFGASFSAASEVLKIHIWAGIFVFLGVASGKYLIAENQQIQAFLRTFFAMIINILLNYILIDKIGIQGAAIATLCSYFFAGFLYDLFSQKMRFIFYMKLKTLKFWSVFK